MHKHISLFGFLLLFSCHVGEINQQYSYFDNAQIMETLGINTQKSANITDHWYEIFKDNDLNTLIQYAINSNFTIRQGRERLKQSRLNLMIRSKQMFPMIDASGNYDFSKANEHIDYSYDINTFKTGIDASWELDIWGKGEYISEQYTELMNNAVYSLSDIKVSVMAEIIANYVNLREAQEKLDIATRNLSLQTGILKIVRDKNSAGVTDNLALNQAEYTVETTKSLIPPLKTQIENYKNALATLLGVLPANLPVDLDKYQKNITADTFKFDTKKLYTLPLSVVRSRPDIMAAETSIRSQNAVVSEAITNLYPTINLSATFGFVSSSGHSLFNNNSQVYGYTPGVTLPIWHWGMLTNNVELQKHIKEEYILNFNEAILTAVMEIKNAVVAVEQAYKTNSYNKTSFNKMQNIMELTRKKYENGLVDFTDVATAEQNLLSAQNALVSSNASILQHITAFYKATGGGYNPTPATKH